MSRTSWQQRIWLAASLAAACSGSSVDRTETHQAEPGSDGESSDGDAQGRFGTVECDECVSRTCGGELEACTADAGCASTLDCVTGCSEDAEPGECFGGCFVDGDPPPELLEFLMCLASQCPDQCGMDQRSD
jgi:hypothetical protein